jgi:predicted lysophospholipase L1 biosynthesis ABC-type transport system permease subunit
MMPTLEERGSPSLSVMARLEPGSTVGQAQSAVTSLGAALEREYPEWNAGMGKPASVFAAGSMQFRGMPGAVLLVTGLLWASVALVLFIGCVNVMGLLMARAAHRRREIAIRVAIGAGRGRVVQAMLVESFLLVVTGLVVGVPLAYAFARSALTEFGPRQDAMIPDGRLVPFAVVLVACITVICGLIPAFRATTWSSKCGRRVTAPPPGCGSVTRLLSDRSRCR